MNKLLIKYIFPVVGLLAFSACHSDEPDEPVATAERTVLVYQEAFNDLGDEGWDRDDINEMRQAAKAGDIKNNHLLVYNSRRSGIYLMEILPDRIDTLKTYDRSQLTVSSSRMKEVLADVKSLKPAPSYGLVLWSHGNGWLQDGISDPMDSPKRSFGNENFRSRMNITTLARVLEGEELDFLYFDCCFMGSVETLYELRDVAPVIVSSPSELPKPGMPYNLNVGPFFRSGSADIVTAAQNTFRYYNSMTGADRTCTMTVTDATKLEALAAATKAIYEKASPTLPVGFTPQQYEDGSFGGYYSDFRQYVNALCFDMNGSPRFENAQALADNFNAAFDAATLYFEATPKLWGFMSLENTTGLSTYILRNASLASSHKYNTLGWYADVASSLKFN